MRRSRLFALFGCSLTVLGVATFSPRSRAAGNKDTADESHPAVAATHGDDLQLTPQLAKREAPLFGSFIKADPFTVPSPAKEACPSDMVEVSGDYCPYVLEKCARWLDPATKLQCAEFEKPASAGHCFMKTEHKSFCIDRYEWPNRAGELPQSMESWREAKASCEGIGKRLCSDTEWTLACEGPERHPYPYGDGYARDGSACNADKPYVWPNPERVYDPKTQTEELARLDQREPSGARASCVSSYGVHDMTGNVDEWVVNVSQFGQPHQSALKGGYWGPVRSRCRPMTTEHEETFRYYQTGFRCCGAQQDGDAPSVASR
jgi:formylglycine-generating enzyme